jgi:chromosome partitioning protein
MSRVSAVTNQKGGVGKTTTAISLAAYLGKSSRVLLVDLDPQANATSALGMGLRPGERSMYDVLLGAVEMIDVIRPSQEPGLDLAPSSPALAGAQVELIADEDRDVRLRSALAQVRDRYDVVIIDCPPALGLLTVNALAATDGVLVPVQCEYLALEGLGQLIEIIQAVRGRLNPSIELMGVLLTMHDSRTNLSAQVISEVRRHFPIATFDHIVPRSVRLSEAPSYGKSIFAYDAVSRGAEAYAGVGEEIIKRGYGR